ncbi:MAG: hypothetical protein IKJ69_00460 [Clostridia bacterium]|nr:hypothetical protein [Clostridia bacterium]
MKKVFALLFAFVLLVVGCFNVTATNEASEVMPRYTHISYVTAGIYEGSLGFVTCTSTYSCLYEDYTFTLTCALQRTNGSGWVNYKTETQSFTSVGANAIEKTWYAPAGYTYRTYTTVVVKNSRTGKVVETATADSPFIYR